MLRWLQELLKHTISLPSLKGQLVNITFEFKNGTIVNATTLTTQEYIVPCIDLIELSGRECDSHAQGKHARITLF